MKPSLRILGILLAVLFLANGVLVVVIQVTVTNEFGASTEAAVAYFTTENPVIGDFSWMVPKRIQPL